MTIQIVVTGGTHNIATGEGFRLVGSAIRQTMNGKTTITLSGGEPISVTQTVSGGSSVYQTITGNQGVSINNGGQMNGGTVGANSHTIPTHEDVNLVVTGGEVSLIGVYGVITVTATGGTVDLSGASRSVVNVTYSNNDNITLF
jgi:hypothetical protein